MLFDLQLKKTKCEHCNSEIEKYEQHFPLVNERNGKEEKYCEIRISRRALKKLRKKSN